MWEAVALYLIHSQLLHRGVISSWEEQHEGLMHCKCQAALRFRELESTFSIEERRKVNKLSDVNQWKFRKTKKRA